MSRNSLRFQAIKNSKSYHFILLADDYLLLEPGVMKRLVQGEISVILVKNTNLERTLENKEGREWQVAFEAAAQEYSYATGYQRIEEDASMDPSDILEYVRATMESLTRDVSEVVGDLTTMPTVRVVEAVAATA